MSKTTHPARYTVTTVRLSGARTETTVRSRKVAESVARMVARDGSAAVSIIYVFAAKAEPVIGFRVIRTGPGVSKTYPVRGLFEHRGIADLVAKNAAAAHGTHLVTVEPVRAA